MYEREFRSQNPSSGTIWNSNWALFVCSFKLWSRFRPLQSNLMEIVCFVFYRKTTRDSSCESVCISLEINKKWKEKKISTKAENQYLLDSCGFIFHKLYRERNWKFLHYLFRYIFRRVKILNRHKCNANFS